MNVYIPNDIDLAVPDRALFILTRPFRANGHWVYDSSLINKWGLGGYNVLLTDDIRKASVVLLPYTINAYLTSGNRKLLRLYSELCQAYGIKAYGFLSGDWGKTFPEFEGITYFRMGGFRSQLSEQNQGFPFSLSDHHQRLYGTEEIQLRIKQPLPVIGFCGHASLSMMKRVKESAKFLIENAKRGLSNPLRSDWEPVFPSAFHRAKLLHLLEQSRKVTTNFVYREHYRAGAITETARDQTTRDYYENIRNSDYVLCVRGGGNFSVRLYETLMMGRIPVFVNTDCLLPFPKRINWNNQMVWVEWKDRHRIDEVIAEFHHSITDADFLNLQLSNRKLWKEVLSVSGIFNLIN